MQRYISGSLDLRMKRRDLLKMMGGATAAATLGSGLLTRQALSAAKQEATPPADLTDLDVETFYVEPTEEFAAQDWTIGFSNASETNTWRTALRESIEEAAGRYPNVELLITDANDSPSKQVADLEDLLARGSRGLIIGAATTDVANPILERAEQENIPVIIVDRLVTSEKYTTFVAGDNTVMASTCLSYLCEDLLGGEGRIAIVEGIPGAGPAVERNAAYDIVLEDYPGIEVAARQAGDWSRASGQQVIENVITAHRDLDGIHFDGGEMALGGILALRAAGISDDDIKAGRPFLTGMDNYNGWLGAIGEELGKFTMAYPPRVHGWSSVQQLVRAMMGETVPKVTTLAPYQFTVTPDNAAEFYQPDQPDDFWGL